MSNDKAKDVILPPPFDSLEDAWQQWFRGQALEDGVAGDPVKVGELQRLRRAFYAGAIASHVRVLHREQLRGDELRQDVDELWRAFNEGI